MGSTCSGWLMPCSAWFRAWACRATRLLATASAARRSWSSALARGLDALSGSVVEEFAACQQERARRGEIGPAGGTPSVKSARLMLEFQATGAVAWRMMSPDPDLALSECSVPC